MLQSGYIMCFGFSKNRPTSSVVLFYQLFKYLDKLYKALMDIWAGNIFQCVCYLFICV